MRLRVREGFAVHLSESRVFAPGEEFEADRSEYERVAHQVEILDKPNKPNAKEKEGEVSS